MRGGSDIPAGVGFVFGDQHIVTCAHVVNTALGRKQKSQDKPGAADQIRVEFPILGDADGAPLRTCRVQAWTPPALSGLSGGDVAGLVLVGEGLPAGAGAARPIDPGAKRDTPVEVFGYPGDPPRQERGAWSRLVLRGAVGGGVMQLDADQDSAIRVQPGYSGSPVVVWDGSRDWVLGMLAIAGRDEVTRDAYAIPAPRLTDAWPEIKRLPESHVLLPRALQVGQEVSAMAFSPDGTRLATIAHRRARIWSLDTGAAVGELREGLAANTRAVAFSPDGARLATGSISSSSIIIIIISCIARIWDASTGELQLQLNHGHGVDALAFSPDGARLATGGRDPTARIWHATTGNQQLQVTHYSPLKLGRILARILAGVVGYADAVPDATVRAVAFSPGGTWLATGCSDKTARIWDASTGELQLQLDHGGALRLFPGGAKEGYSGAVAAVAFSPDGTRLATGSDRFARVWDMRTGQPQLQVTHDSAVLAVAFSLDGTRLVSASGKSARIWDASTGKQQGEVTYSEQTYLRACLRTQVAAGWAVVRWRASRRVMTMIMAQ
jgi:hypothetical protein